MEKVEVYLDKSERIFQVLAVHGEDVLELMKTNAIPKTSETLFMLVNNMYEIHSAIVELSGSDKLYPMNILHRSLIEHFLRFNYIFFRAVETKDDSIGVTFTKTLLIKEQLDIGKAYQKIAGILKKDSPQSAWSVLKEFRGDLSDAGQKEIEKSAEQFTYKGIIAYIDDRINQGKAFDGNILLKMIPKYADLSSFVHGGHLANTIMMATAVEGKIDTSRNEITVESYLMFSASVLFMFMIFVQHDKKFEKPYLLVEHIMNT